jgi:hypothetical protein
MNGSIESVVWQLFETIYTYIYTYVVGNIYIVCNNMLYIYIYNKYRIDITSLFWMKRSKLDAPQDCWNYAFIYLFYCRIGGSIILIGNLSADRTSPQKIRICWRHAKLAAGYSSKKGSHNWLVVWNMFYFSCWEQNFPIWLSYFSEGLKLTTNQIMTCFWASPGDGSKGEAPDQAGLIGVTPAQAMGRCP